MALRSHFTQNKKFLTTFAYQNGKQQKKEKYCVASFKKMSPYLPLVLKRSKFKNILTQRYGMISLTLLSKKNCMIDITHSKESLI